MQDLVYILEWVFETSLLITGMVYLMCWANAKRKLTNSETFFLFGLGLGLGLLLYLLDLAYASVNTYLIRL